MPDEQIEQVASPEQLAEPESPGLRRIYNKQEREKHDEPQAEPVESDEFGLPHRPPRRRTYTLESLDSPERIRSNTIEATNVEIKLSEKGPAEGDTSAKLDGVNGAQKTEDERPTTPLQSPDGVPLDLVRSPESFSSAKSPVSPQSPGAKHKKGESITSVSAWSHQQMAPREAVEEEDEHVVNEGDWQEMPAFATHRVYDDWGKVLAKDYDEMDDQTVAYGTLGGAGKGYTRVQMDEDAQSATSMDDNTAYLFNDQYAKNTLYEEDDEARDVLSQMKTTKELLTDNQKIAYVGVVRLCLVTMAKNLNELDRTKNTKKIVNLAEEALKMWSQRIMLRVYEHIEVDAREQIMVEQLAEHGVLPSDLTPSLMSNARVRNPTAGTGIASQASSSRPSMASPRPSSTIEKKDMSSLGTSISKPGSPAPSPRYLTPPLEPLTPVDDPPPAYEQHAVEDLSYQNAQELGDAKNLDIDIRWTVLCDFFLLLIADGAYDARSRTLLERVAEALSVSWQDVCRFEKRVTDALEMQEEAEKENWNEDDHLASRAKAARNKRLMVMGLCTVGGGLVIGLSAGLLAPVIGAGLAAGFTAFGVSGTGTFLGGAGAAAIIGTGGTVLGGRMGLRSSNRRTGAVKTFEYKPLYNNKRVNLIVTVAGWMTGKVDDVRLPFSTVDPIMGDIYSINWEPEMLQSTGQTIQILGTEALTQTIQQVLGATVLSTLMMGLSTPIILMKISYLIDNPWTTALARGDAAGLILADSIIDRNLGARPITLVGFSLGARVIFSCLKELARRGALGLVQNVYLFGSPIIAKKEEYTRIRSIVSGRFVNGYATNDWILGYLFRATSGGIMRVAGLSSVDVPGIENINVTEHVPGHMAYRGMMPTLLDVVGWQMESLEYTEIEDPDPDNHEKRQRELLDEIEEARKNLSEQPEKKGFKAFFSRKKASQKKAWETYDERSQKVLEGDDKESAQFAEDNANVMFDVDAIRKEALALALQNPGDIEEIKKHLTVREIESTLPALKVTLPPNPSTSTNGMTKPDLPTTRHSYSHEGMRSASMPTSGAASSSTSDLPNGSHVSSKEVDNDDISLTFEDDRSPRATGKPDSEHGESSWPQRFNAAPERPPLRSMNSTPTSRAGRVSPAPPPVKVPEINLHPDHNPWSADADDAEFGQEREMKMEFD